MISYLDHMLPLRLGPIVLLITNLTSSLEGVKHIRTSLILIIILMANVFLY